jgi:hypothetical protein
MNATELKPGIIVRGPVLPEPIEVLVITPLGDVIKIVGAGQKTGQVHQRVLRLDQLQFLDATPEREPFDGDPVRFRLGLEAARLGLAYEYDPYFSLSISRVDPLPHQLEAVYDYFMRLPRIRFLLADDPGAGKTIMAGLLLKELKIRGLVKRTLIVAPANLCFQWQRELKEKFRESFEVIRSDVLRANYGQNPWQEKNQVVTSISWVSRIEDAKESLLRSRWDLVIIDEAHKMAAYSADKKTLAYKLGEALSTISAGRRTHMHSASTKRRSRRYARRASIRKSQPPSSSSQTEVRPRPRRHSRRFVLRSPNQTSTSATSRRHSRHCQRPVTTFQPRRTAIGSAFRPT